MREGKARLALTMGDPGGIGPELVGALLDGGGLENDDIYIVGSASALKKVSARAARLAAVDPAAAAAGREPSSFPAIVDVAEGIDVPSGRPTAEGGLVSGRAVEAAAGLALSGAAKGIVTGPVSKEALSMAGYPYRGHTEMLAALFGAPDCQMMMVSGDLRIVILTRDIPLREVPAAVTRERIVACGKVTDSALRDVWGIGRPRILVAALNPHAGDGGVLGAEEIDSIAPAVEELASLGIGAEGPVPADTLFQRMREKGCDAFIAMYHDQGMIPFKIGGFDEGVNMTIGLPVVRTSVCHGTAYGIAGAGKGSPGSLASAIALASRCCRARSSRAGVEG